MLTETDSPFTSKGGRKSMPWDVIATSSQLAQVRGVSPSHMNFSLKENSLRVLRFAGVDLPNT
ncbi:MAG: TatD family hydrolase [Nitrospinae bacterium]|nr:TatD family hydrolase [Nitrospinota bacterium]